jgi:hypothetical protein
MLGRLCQIQPLFQGIILRRGLSIALMFAYLASQQAVVPHAHGGCSESQSSDHNTRPHFHVACFEHAGHSHDDGHDHHPECDGCHSQSDLCGSTSGQDGHDSDAVYLPNDVGVSLPVKIVVAPDSLQVVSMLVIAATPAPTAISERLADVDMAGGWCPSCPLYLALRALRI